LYTIANGADGTMTERPNLMKQLLIEFGY